MNIQRMHVNQPSTLQPLHELDGVCVLSVVENDTTARVYFLSGDVISQQVPRICLSPGWPRRSEESSI